MELIHNLCDPETLSAGDHHEIMGFTDDDHPHRRQTQLPMNFTHHHDHDVLVAHPTALTGDQFGHETGKEKGSGGRKRKRNNEKDLQKLKEVIHVRAKRGQATDSHSLAERVRREKINERLKCLQNLVPGCYKTMGMAVMLDVVISYVQSLQNQIEFLSMKLSAASAYYDFNSPGLDAVDTMQQPQGTNMNGYDQEQEEEGYGGGGGGLPTANYSNSTWPI